MNCEISISITINGIDPNKYMQLVNIMQSGKSIKGWVITDLSELISMPVLRPRFKIEYVFDNVFLEYSCDIRAVKHY